MEQKFKLKAFRGYGGPTRKIAEWLSQNCPDGKFTPCPSEPPSKAEQRKWDKIIKKEMRREYEEMQKKKALEKDNSNKNASEDVDKLKEPVSIQTEETKIASNIPTISTSPQTSHNKSMTTAEKITLGVIGGILLAGIGVAIGVFSSNKK
jgi:hypothetical protein